MKRFASLDFLRGLAILIMMILHIIADTLDFETMLNQRNTLPLMNLVLLVILPFLGGLAGFFLLVSAISNMVSMYHYLGRGNTVGSLVRRQIIGGMILLFFAYLTEGLTGSWGAFGTIIRELPNYSPQRWEMALYRWNYFETIHTIAWCVILNGIVQGLLSIKGKWKDVRFLIRMYIILAIMVVGLTQSIWDFVRWLVPGYPWGVTDPTIFPGVFLPEIGKAPWWEILRAPFLAVLAAPVEPIFPYLAVSFVGSIIGIVMSVPKSQIPPHFIKRMLLVGLLLWIIGAIGVVFVLIKVIETQDFDKAIYLYIRLCFHRDWVPENPDVSAPYFAWFWQFLTLNGFALMATMIIIYLVDFRGIGPQVAHKTSFIRRFGFIAFTNYNNQWIFVLLWFGFNTIMGIRPYQRFQWGGALLLVVVTLIVFYGLMRLWEKVDYIGTFEWAIGTLAALSNPKTLDRTKHWWKWGALDVEGVFRNPEWITVTTPTAEDHHALYDSKMICKLARISLFSFVFLPITFMTLVMSINSMKKEGKNNYNHQARLLSWIGVCITLGLLLFALLLTPASLGLVF